MFSDTVQDPFDILLNRKPLRTYEHIRKSINLTRSSTTMNSLYSVAEWVEDQNKYLQTKVRSSEISKPDKVTKIVPKKCKNVDSPNLLVNVRCSRRLIKCRSRLISETENKENNPERVKYFSDKNRDGNEKNKKEIKEVFQDIDNRLNIAIDHKIVDADDKKNVSVPLRTGEHNISTRSRRKQCTKAVEQSNKFVETFNSLETPKQNENVNTENIKTVIKKKNLLGTSKNVIHGDQPKEKCSQTPPIPTRQEISIVSPSNILVNQYSPDPFDSLTRAKSLRTYVSLSPKSKNRAEIRFNKTSNSRELGKSALDISLQHSTPQRGINTSKTKFVNDDNEENLAKSNVKRKLIQEDKKIEAKNKECNRIMERDTNQNESIQNRKRSIIKNSPKEILSRICLPKIKNLKSIKIPRNNDAGEILKSPLITKKSLRSYTNIATKEVPKAIEKNLV